MALDDAAIAEIQSAGWWCWVCRCTTSVCLPSSELDRRDLPRQVTFRYTEKGPEGLLGGKKVYVALTRGGRYRDTPADSQVPYLKTVFAFLGMTDVQFVYAEGLAMGPDAAAEALAEAGREIEKSGSLSEIPVRPAACGGAEG